MAALRTFRRVQAKYTDEGSTVGLAEVAQELFSSSKKRIDPFATRFTSLTLSNFDDSHELHNTSFANKVLATASLAVEVRTQLISRMRTELIKNTDAALKSLNRRRLKCDNPTRLNNDGVNITSNFHSSRLMLTSLAPLEISSLILPGSSDVGSVKGKIKVNFDELELLQVEPVNHSPKNFTQEPGYVNSNESLFNPLNRLFRYRKGGCFFMEVFDEMTNDLLPLDQIHVRQIDYDVTKMEFPLLDSNSIENWIGDVSQSEAQETENFTPNSVDLFQDNKLLLENSLASTSFIDDKVSVVSDLPNIDLDEVNLDVFNDEAAVVPLRIPIVPNNTVRFEQTSDVGNGKKERKKRAGNRTCLVNFSEVDCYSADIFDMIDCERPAVALKPRPIQNKTIPIEKNNIFEINTLSKSFHDPLSSISPIFNLIYGDFVSNSINGFDSERFNVFDSNLSINSLTIAEHFSPPPITLGNDLNEDSLNHESIDLEEPIALKTRTGIVERELKTALMERNNDNSVPIAQMAKLIAPKISSGEISNLKQQIQIDSRSTARHHFVSLLHLAHNINVKTDEIPFECKSLKGKQLRLRLCTNGMVTYDLGNKN
ncbi:hypothetical protein P9112_002813 [Eukaryota sp. TZLM1-RC]